MSLALHYDFTTPSLAALIGPTLDITRATKATMVDADGWIREVQAGEARFPGATFVHNLQPVSEPTVADDSTANVAATDEAIGTAPAGVSASTVVRITPNSSTGYFYLSSIKRPDVVAVRKYRISAFVRLEDGSAPTVATTSGATGNFLFILGGNGTGETLETGTEALGNDWYWCYAVYEDVNPVSNTGVLQYVNQEDYSGSDLYVEFTGLTVDEIIDGMTASVRPTYTPTTTAAVTSLTGTSDGLLVEEARTNIALHSEDMSNAAWVASNVTVTANDGTAADGSNTADLLTATAANGTLLQSITSASADFSFAVYIERITGTGNIDLTVDGGSTWTTVTLGAGVNRYDIQQSAVTNPQIGVRIVTSGDAIRFWGAQLEAGAFPTSYIPTEGATVTRNADLASSTNVSWINDDTSGTWYSDASALSWPPNGVEYMYAVGGPTLVLGPRGRTSGNIEYRWDTNNSPNAQLTVLNPALASEVFSKLAVRTAENDMKGYQDGALFSGTNSDVTCALHTGDITDLYIGGQGGNPATQWSGIIREIRYYNERLTDQQLEDMSNGVFPSFDVGNNRRTTVMHRMRMARG